MLTRRFVLPSWSRALAVVRARCASVTTLVKRYPVPGTGAEPEVLTRVRVETARSRFRASVKSTLTLEVDVLQPGQPAQQIDLVIPAGPGALAAWLAMLSRDYAPDEFAATRGTWGTAMLVVEDRGPDRVLVDVTEAANIPGARASWQVPPEWEGAVEVTGDPTWSRAVLTRATWPVITFRPLGPGPQTPLDAASEKCEDGTCDSS